MVRESEQSVTTKPEDIEQIFSNYVIRVKSVIANIVKY